MQRRVQEQLTKVEIKAVVSYLLSQTWTLVRALVNHKGWLFPIVSKYEGYITDVVVLLYDSTGPWKTLNSVTDFSM